MISGIFHQPKKFCKLDDLDLNAIRSLKLLDMDDVPLIKSLNEDVVRLLTQMNTNDIPLISHCPQGVKEEIKWPKFLETRFATVISVGFLIIFTVLIIRLYLSMKSILNVNSWSLQKLRKENAKLISQRKSVERLCIQLNEEWNWISAESKSSITPKKSNSVC